ncbi:hypothetical protein Tco_0865621 [Tanacetum coccineum]
MIDMAELVRLQIYVQLDDTWAWVAMRPDRQPDTAAGALAVAEDALAVDEGDQAILAPGLRRDVGSLRGLRRTRQRTDSASTSIAQQGPQQTKPGSKFSNVVHGYDTEPSRIFTQKARMEIREIIPSEKEAEEKSNLKTSL